MTKRTVSFTASDASTWPTASKASGGTDAWTASWMATTPPLSVIESLGQYITGNRPAFALGINTIPSIASYATLDNGADAAVFTTPSAAGTNFPNYLSAPVGPIVLFVMTGHTADHYHEIDIVNCTNQFRYPYSGKTLTYTKIADYAWNTGGATPTYFRSTGWVVTNGDTTLASGRIRINASLSQGRTAYTSTNGLAGAGTTAPLNATATVQTWHTNIVGIYGAEDNGTSNWAAGIRTANMATTTGTTTAATVTLPSTFTKSNNRMLAFFGRAYSTTAGNVTLTSGSTFLGATNNGSPASMALGALRGIGSTSDATARKAANAITATWLAAANGTQFHGWGVEIIDKSTAQGDTFPSTATNYTAVGLLPSNNRTHADSTTSKDVEVTVTAPSSTPYRSGLIARYCTHTDGKNYAVHFTNLDASQTSGTSHYALRATLVVADPATNTVTETQLGTYYDLGTAAPAAWRNVAARVMQSAGGGLWVSMKAWADGTAEPAWPTSESSANTKDTVNANATWAVLNSYDNGATAQIIAGYSGQVGFYGTVVPADSINTPIISGQVQINAMTDLAIVTGSATITGSANNTNVASGTIITPVAANEISIGSVSSEIVTSVIVREVEAVTLDAGAANGELSASATNILVGASTLSGSGTLDASSLLVAFASSALDVVDSTLTADPVQISIAEATLSGTSTFEDVASISVLEASSALAGDSTVEDVTGTILLLGDASLDATGTLDATAIIASVSVALTATSDLTVAELVETASTVALTGSGALEAIGETQSSVTIDGAAGSLNATADLIVLADAHLTVTSGGSVSATLLLVDAGALAGTSSGSAAALHVNVVTVTVMGVGAVSVASTHINVVQATCTGQGQATGESIHINVAHATCGGQGAVEATGLLEAFANAAFEAATSGIIGAFLIVEEAATTTAIGDVIVAGRWVHDIPNTFRETTSLKIGNSTSSVTIPPIDRAQRSVETFYSTRKAIIGSYTTIALDENP